jgi:hypothetical protein
MSAPGKLTGARLWTVFLTGPGETIRDKSDATACCGEPPAKRHPRSKANRRSFCATTLGISAGSFWRNAPHAFKTVKFKGEKQILRADALRISAQGSDALKAPRLAGDHTARDHPFPSRTRKLSLAGPMVLHGQPCGRLGDRRH